ncbi:MAG TPA: zf-HC2 domain-containing protein [Solirubrobacteraceae bacterium]|jgi:anti-sigma factor RsiW
MKEILSRARFRRDHRWAPGHMSAYLDGELAPRRRTRLERHTRDCADCRRLLAGLRRMLDALSALGALGGVAEPEGADAVQIAAAVRARLEQPPAQ